MERTSDFVTRTLRYLAQHMSAARDFFQGFFYLLNGVDIIHERYASAHGQPFEVLTPGKRHHIIVSPQHIEELNRAPLDVFSLHAVAKDFLQPRATMHGFEWMDIRGQEGTGFVRALRHILTSRLPDLRPAIYESLSNDIRRYLSAHKSSEDGGISEPSVFEMAKTIVANVNCLVFFGPALAANPAFSQAAAAFPHEVAFAAEIVRVLPCKFTRWITRLLTRDHRAATCFHALLYAEVEWRMAVTDDIGSSDSSQAEGRFDDGLQWLIETSRKQNWDVERMVGEVMGIWYGSVHTLSMGITFGLLDLYSRGDKYVKPLRAELAANPLREQSGQPADLPLLDAFLKESARLSAFETTSVRRQALQPFRFKDGLKVQAGDWVCVPTRSLMTDESRVPAALIFDAWRHLNSLGSTSTLSDDYPSPTHLKKQSFLTDTNTYDIDGMMIWGLSRITCPGRFYAALVMKLVLGIFLEDYDVETLDIQGERSFQWRSTIVPKSSIRIRARERERERDPRSDSACEPW